LRVRHHAQEGWSRDDPRLPGRAHRARGHRRGRDLRERSLWRVRRYPEQVLPRLTGGKLGMNQIAWGKPRINQTKIGADSMKKFLIAFVAAMSLAAFGCRKNKAREALAQLTVLKDEMCACTDKTCSDKVSDEYSRWSQAQPKSDGDRSGTPSEQDKK